MNDEIKQLIIKESKNKPLIKSKKRQIELGEVFTPSELVCDVLSALPKETWGDGKSFLDPSCGTGNFLAAVLIVKIKLHHIAPLNTIYGVDIMEDNCEQCRERLLKIAGDTQENRNILNKNIRCANGLEFDYEF